MRHNRFIYVCVLVTIITGMAYGLRGMYVSLTGLYSYVFISTPEVGSVIKKFVSCPGCEQSWQYNVKTHRNQQVVSHDYAIRGDIRSYKVIGPLVVGYSRGQRGERAAYCPKGYFILDREQDRSYEGLPEADWRRLLRDTYKISEVGSMHSTPFRPVHAWLHWAK